VNLEEYGTDECMKGFAFSKRPFGLKKGFCWDQDLYKTYQDAWELPCGQWSDGSSSSNGSFSSSHGASQKKKKKSRRKRKRKTKKK